MALNCTKGNDSVESISLKNGLNALLCLNHPLCPPDNCPKGERQKPDGKCKSENESEKYTMYSQQDATEMTVSAPCIYNLNLKVISVTSC